MAKQIHWKKQSSPTYEAWHAEWKNSHNTRRVAGIALSKTGDRKPYGVSLQAWTNMRMTNDKYSRPDTYKEAKKRVLQYKKEIAEQWGR